MSRQNRVRERFLYLFPVVVFVVFVAVVVAYAVFTFQALFSNLLYSRPNYSLQQPHQKKIINKKIARIDGRKAFSIADFKCGIMIIRNFN